MISVILTYSEQVVFDNRYIKYKKSSSQVLHVEMRDDEGLYRDRVDFRGLPDGELIKFDKEGALIHYSDIPVDFIVSAKKKDGVVYLNLLQWVNENGDVNE